MRNNVRFLSWIQESTIEAVVDLVAELVASELDAARRVKLGHQNSNPLRSEVLSYTAKIFDTKFLTESENSMNQDQIHDRRILAGDPTLDQPRNRKPWNRKPQLTGPPGVL